MVDAALRRARLISPACLAVILLATGVTLTRGPYLQSVTSTSAILLWRTAAPGSSRTIEPHGQLWLPILKSYAEVCGDRLCRTRTGALRDPFCAVRAFLETPACSIHRAIELAGGGCS